MLNHNWVNLHKKFAETKRYVMKRKMDGGR